MGSAVGCCCGMWVKVVGIQQSNNFDVGLLARYLGVDDAVVKALIDHMPKPSIKRISRSAAASKEDRVDEE